MRFSSYDVSSSMLVVKVLQDTLSQVVYSKHRDQMSMFLAGSFKVLIKKKWGIIKLS